MRVAKAHPRHPFLHMVVPVVMEGNVQVTPVGGRRVLAVADQIAFFLVAKHVPGNGDKVSATLEIDHPVVGPIKIAMINPDLMAAGFNADVIPAVFVVLTGRIEHPQVAETSGCER